MGDAYLAGGVRRAAALGNRGPLEFTARGELAPHIASVYWRTGFYIFEGLIDPDETADLVADFDRMMERMPTSATATTDAAGRPALESGPRGSNRFKFGRPLSDPYGGTGASRGRYQARMTEYAAPADAPAEVLVNMIGPLQFMDSFLRLYGHPRLLAVAEQLNGTDFVPFREGVWVKEAGLGPSTAWHQDGTTHWDSPAWDEGIHGFNFMAQLYGCTPANGVWIVPGTHRLGKVDIGAMVAEAGSERLPDAVPIVCKPGDVAMTNRQVLHGSFANTSPDWRVTVNFGFHRRASVLGVAGGGIHNAPAVYDEERIRARSRLIGYAIDARRRRFPEETPFVYQPFAASGERHIWNAEAKAGLRDYNLLDLSI
jgi:hypothetical protein